MGTIAITAHYESGVKKIYFGHVCTRYGMPPNKTCTFFAISKKMNVHLKTKARDFHFPQRER